MATLEKMPTTPFLPLLRDASIQRILLQATIRRLSSVAAISFSVATVIYEILRGVDAFSIFDISAVSCARLRRLLLWP